jgi:hypothetical protein
MIVIVLCVVCSGERVADRVIPSLHPLIHPARLTPPKLEPASCLVASLSRCHGAPTAP